MKTSVLAVIAVLALLLPLQAQCQVMNSGQFKVLKTVKATSPGGQVDVNLAVIPASVKLAGGRSEQGWFLVVTDPRQKLYWWRFQAGTYAEGSSLPADDFGRSCLAYAAPQKLAVFCTTSRNLLIGTSARTYATESAIEASVQSEFNQRAGQLDTGFDFFEKNVNLFPVLGADFFSEPGHADSIRQIKLRSVTQRDDGWELIVAGARQVSAKLTLAPDFSLRGSAILP